MLCCLRLIAAPVVEPNLTTLAYRDPQGTTDAVLPATYRCSCCRTLFDNTALSHPVRYKLRLHYARLYAGGIVDLHSKFGNKRTRFTHYQHRMAHTLRHFCSNSSIGTDTRCCSTPCRFIFKDYHCSQESSGGPTPPLHSR